MSVAALVPARGGSKGLPGKNLAEVGGLTLVERAVGVALATESIGEVVVTSDDDAILDAGERAGATRSRRPAELAGDATPTIDVVRHFLSDRPDVNTVVLLQPTSPLRNADDVRACLTALRSAPSAATVVGLDHPAEWTFRRDESGVLDPMMGWESMKRRRQDASPTFTLNGAVYAARADHLRSGGELVGPGTVGVVMPRERSVDIDDELDLEWARLLARRTGAS